MALVDAPVGGAGGPASLQPVKLFDVTIARTKKYGCAKVEAVPPEEFGIARRAKSIRDSEYCYHECTKSARELIDMGFDEDQIRGLPVADSIAEDSEEAQSRDTVDESSGSDDGVNWVTRKHKLTEHCAFLDYEENGKPALYRISAVGNVILTREGKPAVDRLDEQPFAAMTPIIMPHRFYGRSLADVVMDIQRIKTALMREVLDNTYLANNQRIEISESHVADSTIDDILNNRPGGIVRTKMPGGLVPIPNQSLGEFVFPLVEYMDATREWRTGVTRQGQGIDAKSLQDQSATAAVQLFSMAQARMRLIARIFAETGIRDLFLLLHNVIRRNDRQDNTVKLRGKWVTVAPQEWQRRKDMTVNVGVGTGGKAQMLMFLLQVLGIQEKAIAAGSNLATPNNVFNTLRKIVETGGLKSVDPYFTDPASQPPAQKPPDPKMVEVEAKAKAKEAELQMEAQAAQVEAGLEREKMEREFALRREQMQAEFALSQQEMQAEFALKARLGMMNTMVRAKQAESSAISNVRPGGKVG